MTVGPRPARDPARAACRSASPRPHEPPRSARRAGCPTGCFTGGLAIIFLYPLVWTAVSLGRRRAPGTSQIDGWGFGNYVTLAHYQAGIWAYLGNSLFVSVLTVVADPGHLAARRLRVRPVPLPRQEPAVPRSRWRS